MVLEHQDSGPGFGRTSLPCKMKEVKGEINYSCSSEVLFVVPSPQNIEILIFFFFNFWMFLIKGSGFMEHLSRPNPV